MERQEATGRYSQDMSAMPWGLLWEDMTPSYRLASRDNRGPAGGWEGGSSWDLGSVSFRILGCESWENPRETLRPTLQQGFFSSQADVVPLMFLLRQALNSVLSTGHQRKRPQFFLQIFILGYLKGLKGHCKGRNDSDIRS